MQQKGDRSRILIYNDIYIYIILVKLLFPEIGPNTLSSGPIIPLNSQNQDKSHICVAGTTADLFLLVSLLSVLPLVTAIGGVKYPLLLAS